MIMLRTLHRDISAYNQLDTQEEAAEESGWKLVGWGGSWGAAGVAGGWPHVDGLGAGGRRL